MIEISSGVKTVNLNGSKRNYRKLDNATLRMKIPGEDKVTAKDIWLDALTCQDDWLFTSKNIAARWGIPEKRVKNKLTLLSKAGFAEPAKIIDPKDNKILLHYWIFYESPQPQKRGYGKNYANSCNNKSKQSKSHNPKNGVVVPIIEKEQHKERTTPPNPPLKFPNPPPEKLKPDPGLVDFKNRIKKETLANDFNGNTYQNLKKLELTDGQIKTLIDRMNLSDARTCGWLLLEAKKGDIKDYDIKLEKQRQELERQRQPIPQDNFEPISVEEMRKMTADRRNRQYQTQPTSEPVAPAKPQKSLAFEERKKQFLDYMQEIGLFERYSGMDDEQLNNTVEFQRHG